MSGPDFQTSAARQAVLAELGVLALGEIDLQTLLDGAVRRVREGLDIDTCTVLELLPGGSTLIARAAAGWSAPIAGVHTVDAGRRSQAGFTLLSSEPVIVEDAARETRFKISPILQQHGIRCGMTVLIHGRDRPYGVFGVQSRRLRAFTKEDVDYFQAAANVLASAIERLRAEEELRRSEESFRALIEHAPEGILVSEGHTITYVHRALLTYLGYDAPEELIGRSTLELVHPEEHAFVEGRRRHLEEVRSSTPPRETRVIRRDGSIGIVESVGVPIVHRGRPSLVAMLRDVAERKKMEEQLRQSDRLRSLGTLAAGVAHEINNPLTYVVGNLDLLLSGLTHLRAACSAPGASPADLAVRIDDLAAMAGEAREGGERVRRIVADLKTFSRGEEAPAPVDVRKVMASSINLARNEIRHRAQLEEDYGEAPRVTASESRLGQVFLNLLLNPAQAIPEGASHRNRITVVTRTGDDGRAVIEVRDTGAGIPPEIQGRLFDPFFTTKPAGVGTGLGLAICHNIVTAHGGDITVESEVGLGTTFRVALPAAAETDAPAPSVRPPASPAAPGGRVLIIDDEPFVAAVCRRMLAQEHDVTVVTAAGEALSRIEGEPAFDVSLCDRMMPEVSGMELFEQVERRFPGVAPRFVFLSGGAFSEAARAFRDRVPNLFLDKPCAPDVLRDTVRRRVRVMRQSRGESGQALSGSSARGAVAHGHQPLERGLVRAAQGGQARARAIEIA